MDRTRRARLWQNHCATRVCCGKARRGTDTGKSRVLQRAFHVSRGPDVYLWNKTRPSAASTFCARWYLGAKSWRWRNATAGCDIQALGLEARVGVPVSRRSKNAGQDSPWRCTHAPDGAGLAHRPHRQVKDPSPLKTRVGRRGAPAQTRPITVAKGAGMQHVLWAARQGQLPVRLGSRKGYVRRLQRWGKDMRR